MAGGPPKGTFECFNLGYNFTLKSTGRYTIQTGGGGKWSYTAAAKKVNFNTGPLHFAFAKVRKDKMSGTPVIDIFDRKDRTYYDNCPKL